MSRGGREADRPRVVARRPRLLRVSLSGDTPPSRSTPTGLGRRPGVEDPGVLESSCPGAVSPPPALYPLSTQPSPRTSSVLVGLESPSTRSGTTSVVGPEGPRRPDPFPELRVPYPFRTSLLTVDTDPNARPPTLPLCNLRDYPWTPVPLPLRARRWVLLSLGLPRSLRPRTRCPSVFGSPRDFSHPVTGARSPFGQSRVLTLPTLGVPTVPSHTRIPVGTPPVSVRPWSLRRFLSGRTPVSSVPSPTPPVRPCRPCRSIGARVHPNVPPTQRGRPRTGVGSGLGVDGYRESETPRPMSDSSINP